MNSEIKWTADDMIQAAVEAWDGLGISDEDCQVIRTFDGSGEPCLIVLHTASGRSSDEFGDAGRWNLDGTARA